MPFTQQTRPDGSEEYRLPRFIWAGMLAIPVGVLLGSVGMSLIPDDPDAVVGKVNAMPFPVRYLVMRLGMGCFLLPFILSLACVLGGLFCLVVRSTVVLSDRSLEKTIYVLGFPMVRRKSGLEDITDLTTKGLPTVFVVPYHGPEWLIHGFGTAKEAERFVKDVRNRIWP